VFGLEHTCSTQRQKPIAGSTNGRKTFVPYLSTVACLFLPMSPQATIQNGFDIGTGWSVFFDDGTDVQVGDKLVFNSNSYLIKGPPRPFTGLPLVSHIEVSAVTENTHV
jgi:hypothetical protein